MRTSSRPTSGPARSTCSRETRRRPSWRGNSPIRTSRRALRRSTFRRWAARSMSPMPSRTRPSTKTWGAGHGFVTEFDTNGNFLRRIATQGTLDSPWGLAIAPISFGALAGDLLVGNFGDGRINVFNLTTLTFDGQLLGGNGTPVDIDGLW